MSRFKQIALFSALCLFLAGPAFAGSLDELKARVSAVSTRLEPATGLKPRIIVVNDTVRNAWVQPDRSIIITTGLLSECASDDEMAFIIAHEASHVISKDYREKVPEFSPATDIPAGELAEISADINGAFFARKAGFTPDAALKILSKISSETNAFHKRRLATLKAFLKRSD
ncbi:MAG: M48 family metalloprotease [Deltaproteobacteria bacterium]|nr:M48 family metalloprotease [Deltaproteobacteria bacterium]